MTKWAFESSEKIKNVCVIRSVTRVSHARGDVRLAELVPPGRSARFAPTMLGQFTPLLVTLKHNMLHQKVKQAREAFETSEFNWYTGPEKPELLIVTCGSGWYYSLEAVRTLGLEESVGILKLGTTWPLPEKLVLEHLARTDKVLVVEEVDPFLEGNLKRAGGRYVLDPGLPDLLRQAQRPPANHRRAGPGPGDERHQHHPGPGED